jgi:hypothetical protein
MRTFPSGLLTALAAGKVEIACLVEMFFSTGTVRLTDYDRPVSYGGNDFLATGHLLEVSEIRESSQVIVTDCTVTLSGIDQSFLSLVLGETYLDRRLVLYKAFLDASGSVLHAVSAFDGRMDSPAIVEDPDAGTCTVSVTASSYWADFERRPGRHTNHEEMQLYFPGDRFFEFTSEVNRQITWGDS